MLGGFSISGPIGKIMLELKSSFASAFGQSLYTPMIKVAATVEHHLVDTSRFCTFGDEFAYFGGLVGIVPFQTSGRCCCQGVACQIIDYLAVDGIIRAVNAQTWALCRAVHFLTDAHVDALAALLFCTFHRCCINLGNPDCCPGLQLCDCDGHLPNDGFIFCHQRFCPLCDGFAHP